MKMILAIVSNDDSGRVSGHLTDEGYSVTRLATTGGFLRAGNTTLLVGVEDDKVEAVIDIIAHNSKKRTRKAPAPSSFGSGGVSSAFPVEVTVGGATIFVLDVAQMEKI